MALIVEDGTGVSLAASYATVAFCDAYYTDRAHLDIATAWAAESAENKEGALREASDYVDATFGRSYLGKRAGYTQGLLWPRTDALDEEGHPLPALPTELQKAACELAGRAISAVLAADQARGGGVKQNTVDGAVTQIYFDGATSETYYGAVYGILESILDGTQGGAAIWNWA